jgi:hypothetical protein
VRWSIKIGQGQGRCLLRRRRLNLKRPAGEGASPSQWSLARARRSIRRRSFRRFALAGVSRRALAGLGSLLLPAHDGPGWQGRSSPETRRRSLRVLTSGHHARPTSHGPPSCRLGWRGRAQTPAARPSMCSGSCGRAARDAACRNPRIGLRLLVPKAPISAKSSTGGGARELRFRILPHFPIKFGKRGRGNRAFRLLLLQRGHYS